jgi:hypothetical protein
MPRARLVEERDLGTLLDRHLKAGATRGTPQAMSGSSYCAGTTAVSLTGRFAWMS